MSVYDWIKTKDRQIADEYAGTQHYYSLSPTRWSHYRILVPLLQKHCKGRCLDAGAGRMAYRETIESVTSEYIPMDIKPRKGLHVAGSVLDIPWQENTFDSILCMQVLEHVPEPQKAVIEFHRCLKPGGVLILSVPHLAYLHNEPHDYFRYTKHGIRFLLEQTGFTVDTIVPAGGLFSFLGHIPSMLFKAIAYPIPIVNRVIVSLNSLYSRLLSAVDAKVEKKKLFALNYIAVAYKNADSKND